MSIANVYWLPTTVLLVVLIVAVLACFLAFSSLRVYRRRRNWIIYAFIVVLIGVTAFEAYDTSIGPAIITYSIHTTENQFSAVTTNRFEIECTNLGNRRTSFNLVAKFNNASLAAQSEKDYSQINSTTIKIPFALETLKQTQTKSLQFMIAQDVMAFEFSLYMDYNKDSPIVTGGTVGAQCVFSNDTNRYTINLVQGPVV
jgi:hypothetical protein